MAGRTAAGGGGGQRRRVADDHHLVRGRTENLQRVADRDRRGIAVRSAARCADPYPIARRRRRRDGECAVRPARHRRGGVAAGSLIPLVAQPSAAGRADRELRGLTGGDGLRHRLHVDRRRGTEIERRGTSTIRRNEKAGSAWIRARFDDGQLAAVYGLDDPLSTLIAVLQLV